MLDWGSMVRSSLAALVLMFCSQVAAAFTYEITEAELQQKTTAAMPLEIKKPHYTLLISDPVIDLGVADDDITILAKIDLTMPGIQAAGNIKFKGRLTYDADSYSVFLKNVEVQQVLLEGVPETYSPGVKLISQLAASKMFASNPVYVIKDDGMKARFAKSFLKSMSVKDDKLILFMEIF
jgi:hypothetical protein